MLRNGGSKALAVKRERIATSHGLIDIPLKTSIIEPLRFWVPLVPNEIPLYDLLLGLRHNNRSLSHLLHFELVLADDAVRDDQE